MNFSMHLYKTKTKLAGLWLAVVCGCVGNFAFSQELSATFPNKPIHMVVPFPAGGSADIVARIIAKPLAEKLGQEIGRAHV